MVRASEFKYQETGFDPLVGQNERQVFFHFLRVNSRADVFVPDPPSCVGHAPKCARMLKILYPSVVEEYASQPVVRKHENTARREN